MRNGLSAITILPIVAVLVAAAVVILLTRQRARQEKVSQFGAYRGYSQATYNGNERRSDYLTLSDGTRLAYDLLLPTKDGVPAADPLPALFNYTPYLRTFTIFDADGTLLLDELYTLKWVEKVMLRIRRRLYNRGHLMDPLFRTRWLKRMLAHGYAVVVVERPGTGASFGVMDPSFEAGAQQVDEILGWIAARDWCNGHIGMYGDSWQAMIQFAAASTGNPHLKAIFPVSSALDNYTAVTYRGGVYNKAFNALFAWSNTALERLATPVERDPDGVLLARAREERSGATVGEKSAQVMRAYPFHDSTDAAGRKIWEGDFALYPLLERINRAGVPTYMTNGWFDLFTGDMFRWYANLTVPRRLLVRPLDHSQVGSSGHGDVDYGAEVHRWFDYWLRGIDNGIADEPPVHYTIMGVSEAREGTWRATDEWPLASQALTRFHFAAGKTGSAASVNDGFLRAQEPEDASASDAYTVDYGTTSGERSRWSAVLHPRECPNLRANDEKTLTYTTALLEADLEVTGHPVAHIWLATDAPDLDLFVTLEEVDPQGDSTYITEGNLRASHRALSAAPYDNLGLPYQSHNERDLAPIPAGEAIELAFDLLPTSYRFQAGHRIRVSVAFADADNFDTPILDPAPRVRLLRDVAHPSGVELPIIPAEG